MTFKRVGEDEKWQEYKTVVLDKRLVCDLEMIMNGFNEKIIEQINLDTKNLYDYTKFEKINETWNGCYHDFEI